MKWLLTVSVGVANGIGDGDGIGIGIGFGDCGGVVSPLTKGRVRVLLVACGVACREAGARVDGVWAFQEAFEVVCGQLAC